MTTPLPLPGISGTPLQHLRWVQQRIVEHPWVFNQTISGLDIPAFLYHSRNGKRPYSPREIEAEALAALGGDQGFEFEHPLFVLHTWNTIPGTPEHAAMGARFIDDYIARRFPQPAALLAETVSSEPSVPLMDEETSA